MKTRIIWTKIWTDKWFRKLNHLEQKLFIYFISNSHINLCGCYELSDEIICFETLITPDQLVSVKERLNPKVLFYGEWVYIPKAREYSGYKGSRNEIALDREENSIPIQIKESIGFNRDLNTLSIPYGYSSDTTINKKQEIRNKKQETRNKKLEMGMDKLDRILSLRK